MKQPKATSDHNSQQHPLIFKIILALIPFIILLVLEGLLRLAGYGDNLSLFIKNSTEGYGEYMVVNPKIGKKYFQKMEYTAPANDIFYATKPDNTFRIFVMGSSTVYGFPYERNLMFSRIMHKQLEDAFPDKKIEVVNTAITAINSFTLLDFSDEIIKYEPDAVLIYAGHNEFYGAFGIGSNETMSRNRTLTRFHIWLMDLRMYQLIRSIISGTAEKLASNKNEVHGTLMKRMVADKEILYGSEEYKIAMKRYEQNMDEILQKFQEKEIPVFISELVCNVSGMEPFYSVKNDTMEAAIDVYKNARNAELNQDFDNARKLYYRAKDLDGIRFRASEEINRIVNELAGKYRAFKVPMLQRFQEIAVSGLIGNNLMTEHVHPNVDGNFLMAEAFFNELIKSGIMGEPNTGAIHSGDYYKMNWGYTELDTLLAFHRVKLLKGFWPFVKAEQNETNHLLNYHPKSFLDSLAFSTLKNPELNMGEVRLKLAKEYEKTGQTVKAYKEYEALLRTNPYIAVNYRDAATCLLQLGDLPLALNYFRKSLEYEESFYALFRMGEIYLIKGDYDGAASTFEECFALAPDDKKVNVLSKTYMAFVYGNKTGEAKAVAAELERVNARVNLQIPEREYVFDKYIPFQTKEEIARANELIEENRNEEALEILKASLQIYDSHIANRLIGRIYFKQQDMEQAFFYYNKVYDLFKFDTRFLEQLFTIYLKKNDLNGAKKCVDEINRINPGYKNLAIMKSLIS